MLLSVVASKREGAPCSAWGQGGEIREAGRENQFSGSVPAVVLHSGKQPSARK